MDSEDILARLRSMANPANVAGMARYGINPHNTLGISIYVLRDIAKQLKRDLPGEPGRGHALAEELWASGIHEARLLAVFLDDPSQVTPAQMERWAADFDSWDVCDQACTSLFDGTPHAWVKAVEWSGRSEEFVKRGGFALMAGLAWHNKKAADEQFELFFPIILREAGDERNFVKKAVNWALRNIGKRNKALNARAIETARQMAAQPSKAARWNAADALRELAGEKVQARLA